MKIFPFRWDRDNIYHHVFAEQGLHNSKKKNSRKKSSNPFFTALLKTYFLGQALPKTFDTETSLNLKLSKGLSLDLIPMTKKKLKLAEFIIIKET